MTSVRGWVLGVLAWLLVVLVGSSLVWVVISRAGEGVAPSPDAADPGQVGAGGPASSSEAPSTLPSTTTRPTLRPVPSGSGEPSGSPGAAVTASPGGESASSPPSPPTTSSGPVSPAVRRTWSGVGGTLVVECRGETIRMVATQPDRGFAVEVLDRGPHQVKVQFRGSGEEQRESQVEAECEAGAPHFSAEDRED